jgi:hypothetical protein
MTVVSKPGARVPLAPGGADLSSASRLYGLPAGASGRRYRSEFPPLRFVPARQRRRDGSPPLPASPRLRARGGRRLSLADWPPTPKTAKDLQIRAGSRKLSGTQIAIPRCGWGGGCVAVRVGEEEPDGN